MRTNSPRNVLDTEIAVSIEITTPTANVTAKPLIIGAPKLYKIQQVMSVEVFESRIELQAREKPISNDDFTDFPDRNSSFIRSNIKMFASTAIPTESTNPAIPASVRTIGHGVILDT